LLKQLQATVTQFSQTSKLAIKAFGENLPWWVNAIYKVGVPTAIACYLVWFLTSRVQTNLDIIQIAITKHVSDQTTSMEYNRQALNILRTMCVNAAKTDDARTECLK
jgi:hypothetical protein